MTDSGSLYIGLMSGTSVDAIDSALLRIIDSGTQLLATHEYPIPAATRNCIAAISHAGDNEIERLGPLDRELGELFAKAALTLLTQSGMESDQVRAIGSHGQTIRHRPPSGGATVDRAFTLQIADPNTIAEHTGITTVADFRRRDVSAGGEGAPLAPAFHAAAFSQEGTNRAIVNIGGIANVSILAGEALHSGFDAGPGNTLMDQWIGRHRGQTFDRDGEWATKGRISSELLDRLLQHPFFGLLGPRSTGKEDFNLDWLDQRLTSMKALAPQEVQATLAELTAMGIARGIENSGVAVGEVFVCGGGAHNRHLMSRLHAALGTVSLDTTAALGMDPDWVEAATFAWLAHRTLEGLPGNEPAVTGAAGYRVLGGIYPA